MDHVLPEVPYRQWVLTVPHCIRYLIAFDRVLCSEVRRIFIRAVQSPLRLKARRREIRKGRAGAVNLNPLFHSLVLDGVYAASPTDDTPEFHLLTDLDDDEVHDLTWKIRGKVLRMLVKKGILTEDGCLDLTRILILFPSRCRWYNRKRLINRFILPFHKKKRSSMDIRTFLGKAISKAGKAPKHIIVDRDKPFDCRAFRKWCKRKDIRPRYGAVGKSGSIAVVERFIRTMKNECTRKILVPLHLNAMRQELTYYMAWYNGVSYYLIISCCFFKKS